MTAVTPSRQILQVEETRFRAAVSESTMQKLAGSMNFMMGNLYEQKQFYVNGVVSALSIPFLGIDGLEFMFNNSTIIDVFMFVKTAGSSGSTSLDVKYATTPGGTFTSIFTTPPSINYQAGNYVWVNVGSVLANTTAPVLAVTSLAAGTALRCDILNAQSGGIACGLVLRHQPA